MKAAILFCVAALAFVRRSIPGTSAGVHRPAGRPARRVGVAARPQGLPAGADRHHRAGGGLRRRRWRCCSCATRSASAREGEGDRPLQPAGHLRRRRSRRPRTARKVAGAGGMFSFADDRWRYRGGVGRPTSTSTSTASGGPLGTDDRSSATTSTARRPRSRCCAASATATTSRRALDLPRPRQHASTSATARCRPSCRSRRPAQLGPRAGVGARLARQHLHALARLDAQPRRRCSTARLIGSDKHVPDLPRPRVRLLPAVEARSCSAAASMRAPRAATCRSTSCRIIDLRGIPAARYQDQSTGVGRDRAALERDAALGADRLRRRRPRLGLQHQLQRRGTR